MKSLRSHEGYMYLDNRHAPVDDATMIAAGYVPGAGRGLYESATYTCSHCNYVVVIEPARTRPRGYCKKCDQRICDGCEAIKAVTFECLPMKKLADDVQEAAAVGANVESVINTWEQSRILLK